MELEQDTPEPVDEQVSPLEGEDRSEAVADDAAPSDPAPRDDGRAARDDAIASQARFYQEELERTRRELEAIRASQRPDPREEQARLEAMDPEQRITYIFEKGQRDNQNQVARIEAAMAAQVDQLKFESQLSQTAANLGWSSATKAKYSAEIEAMYNSLVQRNLTIPRSDLLKHKLGDELMTSGAKAIKGASDKGKANIGAQRTKMTPASSNVTGKSTGKTKVEESRERLLQAGVLEM
jgi:hypothetical protein